MGLRHKTRRLALQALYSLDYNPEADPLGAAGAVWGEAEEGEGDKGMLDEMVEGAWTARGEVDDIISSASHNWKLSRMDRVDRSILRLSVFELLRKPDVPTPVVLSEAVELAKAFGAPESPGFVNGILDKIARQYRADEVKVAPRG